MVLRTLEVTIWKKNSFANIFEHFSLIEKISGCFEELLFPSFRNGELLIGHFEKNSS